MDLVLDFLKKTIPFGPFQPSLDCAFRHAELLGDLIGRNAGKPPMQDESCLGLLHIRVLGGLFIGHR